MHWAVTSQANACTSQVCTCMYCMHCPMTSQADACSYCLGSVVLISSLIYLYLQLVHLKALLSMFFFWFKRVLDLYSQYWSGQIQNIESLKRLYSVRWGGNKWPRRPLGVNYSVEAYGHCVKVGLVVLLLKRELDSLTECLRWWWSGWPPLRVTMWVIPEDLGNFSPKKEKNYGEQKFASFGVEFLR